MQRTIGNYSICVLLVTLLATVAQSSHSGGSGQAKVTMGGAHHNFIVIQCLRDITGPHSDTVVEFQLEGVPEATPKETIQRLLGVIERGDNVMAELMPVVEFGPILSITRVRGGGELLTVTNLDDLTWTSDGSPLEASSRSLDIILDAPTPSVSGTTRSGGQVLTVEATCPGPATSGNSAD